jgi:hypothetical protein
MTCSFDDLGRGSSDSGRTGDLRHDRPGEASDPRHERIGRADRGKSGCSGCGWGRYGYSCIGLLHLEVMDCTASGQRSETILWWILASST